MKDKFFIGETKGLLYALLATVCYCLMLTDAKLSYEVPNTTLVFFRNFICFVGILFVIFKKDFSFKTKRPFLHLFRALCGVGSIYCFFYSVKHLVLVDALLLFNTLPLFIPLVLLVWIRDKITPQRAVAIAIGFTGIVCILRPQFHMEIVAGLVGLLGGLLAAVSHVSIKELSKSESKDQILFYFFFGAALFSAVPYIFSYKPAFNPTNWIFIFGAGFFAILFQLLLIRAYALASPSKVSSMLYFTVVWGGVADWIIWNRVPDIWTLLGTVLVVGSGVYSLFEKGEEAVS